MCQHKNSVELRRGQIKAVVLGCQPVRKCPTLANMTAAAMTAEADNSTRQNSTSTARSDVQLFTGFTFFFQQTFLGCLAAISADSSCYLPQQCARMGRYCISGDTKNRCHQRTLAMHQQGCIGILWGHNAGCCLMERTVRLEILKCLSSMDSCSALVKNQVHHWFHCKALLQIQQ